jgi:thiamine-phosphate pyrophosphorylase
MPMIRAGAPSVPRLVLVTDRHATAGRDLVDVVCAALDAGLPAVQLREKDLPGVAVFALAERMRSETAARGALLFVNERVDVAVAVGADGVQLGHGAFGVADARRLLSPGALVGVSIHAATEVARAADADFLLFGAVYPTPGKNAVGVAALRAAVAAAASLPVLAIGGITAVEVPELRAAGAAGVAVIRTILAARDAAEVTRALLGALDRAPA